MIGYLKGKLINVYNDRAIFEVNGVGYEVIMPALWLENTAKTGESYEVFIHTSAKDNDISLIGLTSYTDKLMLERLIKVSSVGPKTALAVLNKYNPDQIQSAVEKQDVAFFADIKGVAKKTALKIIIELRSQFKAIDLQEEKTSKSKHQELISALSAIGFSQAEIKTVLSQINDSDSIEKQVKKALLLLSK